MAEGDLVKGNCDATYNPSTGNGNWGCVLRDSAGDVVTALRRRTEALLNPLRGAVTAGVAHVVIKTDAIATVQAVYSGDYDLSAVSNLVEELRSLLAWNFISWKVQ